MYNKRVLPRALRGKFVVLINIQTNSFIAEKEVSFSYFEIKYPKTL